VLRFLPGQLGVEIDRRGGAGDIDPQVIILQDDDVARRIIVQVVPSVDRRIVAEVPELPEMSALPAITLEGGGWLVPPPCRAG
jgi:hypothetical protein